MSAEIKHFIAGYDRAVAPDLSDTDIANARRFAAMHGANVRFTPERGWMVFDGRRWVVDEKSVRVQALAKETACTIYDEIRGSSDKDERFKHAQRSQSKSAIEAMIWLARSETGIPARIVDFDGNPWVLNCENGTVDLRTGQLRPHDRSDLCSLIAPVAFNPDAGFDLWDAFLCRITDNNQDVYDYLRRLVGYLLTGDVSEQALHFLFGSGANGKSVFCEVVMRLLGDYAATASPDLIMSRRHGGIPNDVARLRGVRVALMNETSQGARFDEAKLKDLTGGDTLTARFLHQEFFDFRPTHKLVIRGNHKPAITGTDEGIWRRLRLVPFTVSIPPAEQDHQLLRTLEAELPGILRWAVEACLEWQRVGLSPPAVIADAVRQYRAEADVLGRFIEERCDVQALFTVRSSAFFSAYQDYCQRAAERWIPSKDLPAEMMRRGFTWKRTNQGGAYQGVAIRQEWPGSDG